MSDAKAVLRHTLRRARATLPPPYREDATKRVNEHIAALPSLLRGRNIGAYAATASELTIDPVLRTIMRRVGVVYLPRVVNGGIEFAPCASLDNLVQGFAGIREPATEPIDPENLDVILVPGVGFDHCGHRLGHGAGHYDRLLSQVPSSCITIGVAFETQIVPAIPVESHDVPVRWLITEIGARDTTVAT